MSVSEKARTVNLENDGNRELLREQFAEVELLYRTAPVGLCLVNTDLRFVRINETLATIHGLSVENHLGRHVREVLPDIADRIEPIFQRVIDSGEPALDIEIERRHPKNPREALSYLTSCHPLTDSRKAMIGVSTVVQDITGLRGTERELRASEARFRALVENSYDVINLFAPSGEPVYVSPSVKRVLGYEPHELLDIPPHELLHPDDVEEAVAGFSRYLTQPGSVGHFTHRLRHKDGSYRTVEVTGTNLLEEPGIQAMVSIFRDITERVEAEERLRERESQLAHVSRLSTMGEMVAGIAHEIKQPLHAIANFAAASAKVLRDIGGKENMEENVVEELIDWNEHISETSHRASEIVSRLRSFVLKSEQRLELVSLARLLRESVELMAFEARQHQVAVEFQLADDLPPVSCDPIQIQQVVVNLLHNAYEAFSDGVDRPRCVVLCAARSGDQVEVQLSDNGPGVPENVRGKLFDAFYTTKKSGMGMGLAISRTIIEAHGGRVWFSTGDPGGAVFHFVLPRDVDSTSGVHIPRRNTANERRHR